MVPEKKTIVCFNCGHTEPEENFSMRVLMEDYPCPSCGEVLVKKPLTGDLPGPYWDKKFLGEFVLPSKRFTNRLGSV